MAQDFLANIYRVAFMKGPRTIPGGRSSTGPNGPCFVMPTDVQQDIPTAQPRVAEDDERLRTFRPQRFEERARPGQECGS